MVKTKYNQLGLSLYSPPGIIIHVDKEGVKRKIKIPFSKIMLDPDLKFEKQLTSYIQPGRIRREDKKIEILIDVLKIKHQDKNGRTQVITATLDNFILE